MRLGIALALGFGLPACGGDGADGSGVRAGCAGDTRARSYQPGMTALVPSTSLVVRLLDAQPGPPDRGENTFRVRLEDAASAPVETATVTVRPWMPDHGHGATPEVWTLERTGPGEGRVGPINFFMPGLWEVQVRVQAGGAGASSRATFPFCVEG
jgi:hypothetical protein